MKYNILSIIAVLTIALMTQNLFAQNMKNYRKDGNQFSMYQKLNLTEEQQDQVITLKLNHQMEMIDFKANLEKKKLELVELKNDGNYSRENYLDKVEAINLAKNQISISKANFQMDVYQLLDDNQKKEWNKCSQFYGERKEKRTDKKMRNIKYD